MNKQANPARLTRWLRRIAGTVAAVWKRTIAALAAVTLPLRNTFSKSQRLFLTNVGIATLVAVVVAFFHQNQWLVSIENTAMDIMMELNQGLPRMSDNDADNPLRFSYLDIDDRSFHAWNEPFHTPRDKLQELIEYAASSGARLIVVDFDLSHAGLVAEHDAGLARFLSEYGNDNDLPPLILVRNFYRAGSANRDGVEIRASFLDDVELSADIYWAQPLFRATLSDDVVRHWFLVKIGCLNGRMMLLPAVQLLAAGMLTDVDSAAANRVANLGSVGLENCTKATDVDSKAPGTGRYRGDAATDTSIDQRIIYTMPWQKQSPDLVTISAQLVTDSSRTLSGDLVRDTVTIIGASHVDSGDIHRTPIGNMPGALIIANAIKSLALYGQMETPPAWLQWTAKLTIIFFAAWIFMSFRSLLGVVVAGTVILLVLVPINFYFFKYGLWIDFALPLFAMLIHRAIAEYRGAQREALEISERHRGKED
ncbi:MAG: CHASE2 domain-containing protein [Woeseiaceae bacterium]|nr:CHASE2 domain-containing protein [Woeseiaceae bacterium]